jgi:protein-tyrosine phosphatase
MLSKAKNRLVEMINIFRVIYQLRREGKKIPIDPQSLILPLPVDADVEKMAGGGFRVRWQWAESTGLVQIFAGPMMETIDFAQPLWSGKAEGLKEAVVRLPSGQSMNRPIFAVRFEDRRILYVAERILPMTGTYNFRDIGGYRTQEGLYTRWGALYRSSHLGEITESDASLIHDLNIRLICDMRSELEVLAMPNRILAGAQQHNTPILLSQNEAFNRNTLIHRMDDLESLLLEAYTEIMLDQYAKSFGEILHTLAEPGVLPAVIHCTAGKDRTGLLTMLLLGALGVPEATIIADYSQTNLFYQALKHSISTLAKRLAVVGLSMDHVTPLLVANPRMMSNILAYIKDKYGGIMAYLRGPAGLSEATISALRRAFLINSQGREWGRSDAPTNNG